MLFTNYKQLEYCPFMDSAVQVNNPVCCANSSTPHKATCLSLKLRATLEPHTNNHTWLVSHSLSHQTKLATETFHPYTIHIWELCSGSVGFIRAPGLRVMSWINIVGPSSNIIFTVSHLTYFLLRPPAEAHVQNHVLDYILE